MLLQSLVAGEVSIAGYATRAYNVSIVVGTL
jgi:hypothetical protein